MNYKFVLVDANSADRQEWILTPPVVVGRCPTVDINLNDASISRKHCQFLINPHGSLVVRDLGSKNGVFVDEQRVDKAIVVPGVELRIGLIRMRAELTDEEAMDDPGTGEIYDLGETQPVEIYRPEDDRYEIG